ncbi:MAG: hypothetical protein JWP89_6216 [Schlesneria sp.]|nr:hypothetical protein [Schlesneria sp.]
MRILPAVLCWVWIGSHALAEDPPAETISGAVYQIEAIEDKFTAEVSVVEARVAKAEAELAKAKQNAGAVRLKSYKSRLADLTKTGNTAQAAAVQARIEWLEESPEIPSLPALNQLPPGAVVYQYFPEQERPYLIKDYVMHMSGEAATMDSLTKKLGSAKGAAAEEEAQKTLDQMKAMYEQQKSTNEPPFVSQDLNSWGQSKRGGYLKNGKPVEWKPGMVGTENLEMFIVVEILSKDQVVLNRINGKLTQTIVAQGFETSKMKVGGNVLLGQFLEPLWVSGTTFRRASNGKQVEVVVIEKFDWDRYKEEQEKLMKK